MQAKWVTTEQFRSLALKLANTIHRRTVCAQVFLDRGGCLGEVSNKRKCIQCSVSSALLHYVKWSCFSTYKGEQNTFCYPSKFSFVVMPEKALIAGHVLQHCLPYWSLLPLVLTICWFVFYERCEAEIMCTKPSRVWFWSATRSYYVTHY